MSKYMVNWTLKGVAKDGTDLEAGDVVELSDEQLKHFQLDHSGVVTPLAEAKKAEDVEKAKLAREVERQAEEQELANQAAADAEKKRLAEVAEAERAAKAKK